MQAMADLPTTLGQNGLMVTGRVEGSDTSFKIDTAAQQTALTPSTAELLARTGPSSGDAFTEITLAWVRGLWAHERGAVSTTH